MNTVNYGTDGLLLSALIGSVLPILVGLFTHEKMPSWLRALALLFVSGASGVLQQWLDSINNHTHFAWQTVVLAAAVTYISGIASYLGLLTPTGITAKVANILVTPPVDPIMPVFVNPAGVPFLATTVSTGYSATNPAPAVNTGDFASDLSGTYSTQPEKISHTSVAEYTAPLDSPSGDGTVRANMTQTQAPVAKRAYTKRAPVASVPPKKAAPAKAAPARPTVATSARKAPVKKVAGSRKPR